MVGVEEVSTVGGQAHILMLHSLVHDAEDRQQPAPGVVSPLQDLFAVLIGLLAQLGLQRGDGVILVIEPFAQQQHVALLRRHKEDEPHHHRERCFVQFCFWQGAQQLAILVLVDAVKRLYKHLDCAAYLVTQLVGHYLPTRPSQPSSPAHSTSHTPTRTKTNIMTKTPQNSKKTLRTPKNTFRQ